MKYQINLKYSIVEMNSEEILKYITYRLSNDYIASIQALEIINGIYQYEKLAYKGITLNDFKEAIENTIYKYHHIDFYKIEFSEEF